MPNSILIVEDEENILKLLFDVLNDVGDYQILYARDGEEALTIARLDNPDIMILDIQLPKLNGYKVCKLIKSGPAISHIQSQAWRLKCFLRGEASGWSSGGRAYSGRR